MSIIMILVLANYTVQHTHVASTAHYTMGGEDTDPEWIRLQLVLLVRGTGRSLDRLHEAEARVLDGLDGGVLLLHKGLVLGLKLLDLLLEGLLGGRQITFLLGDGSIKIVRAQCLKLLDLGLLVVIAQVNVLRAAAGLEVFVRESLEVVERATTFIILQTVGVTMLDGGETLDTVGVAEGLAGGGAVHVANEGGGVAFEFSHELVPSRLHGFAVASPRGLELDEDGLAGSHLVPIVWGEGGRRGDGNESKEDAGFHHFG